MARLRAILKALAAVTRRERKSFGSIASNNFFLFSIVFLGPAAAFLMIVGGLVVLFPLSADPLQKIPPERLALWPLTKNDRRVLRMLSPWLNPITWLLAVLAGWSVRHTESASLFALATGLFLVGFMIPPFSWSTHVDAILRGIPSFGGAIGQLMRKNLREMLSMLDFYIAAILSFSAVAYRIFIPQLPGDALMAMTLLIVLALSSYAQCLFGLESIGGITRYHLLPMHGWSALFAKDIAFLMLVIVLTAPLAIVTGLAAGLAVLAVGHATSVTEIRTQTPWRFTSGASFGNGLMQVILMSGAGVTAYRINKLVLIPCVLVCAASTLWFGRKLQRPVDSE